MARKSSKRTARSGARKKAGRERAPRRSATAPVKRNAEGEKPTYREQIRDQQVAQNKAKDSCLSRMFSATMIIGAAAYVLMGL
jgi:hypothetical protein